MSSEDGSTLSIAERLQLMLSNPKRRNRGQVPMDQVQQAIVFQREYVPQFAEFNVDAVSDCSESLLRLRNDKREAREHREMTWEDHVATTIRDEELRVATAAAKKLAQETAMLAQLKTDKDKWNMAVELKLTSFLQTTLSVVDADTRREYLASRNTSGQTPLHRAASKAKDPRLVQLLLDLGADPAIRDDLGRSVFHVTAEAGLTDIFRILLRVRAVREALVLVNNAGFSLLHVASMHGFGDILQSVLQALDTIRLLSILNLQTKRDRLSALHLAAKNGHERCLRLLLETKGIRIDLHNSSGSNALHLVLQQTFNINNLVQVFLDTVSKDSRPESDDTFDSLDENSGLSCLHTAILKNFREVALKLIKLKRIGLNVSTRDGGWGALHLAVLIEDIHIVKALLDGGAMTDNADNDGQTPLLLACLGGQLDVVRVLLQGGATPTQQNKQGHSPLHYLSAFCRDRELLIDLITRGADVNAKSLKLNTPMHFAAMNGNEVATQVLLEFGATASAINEDKRSVIYLAKKWRHRAVEDLVKPPEEMDGHGADGGTAGAADQHHRTPQFGTQPARRAVPFTTTGGHAVHNTAAASASHGIRIRTPLTTRSDDSDADSVYSFDDEEILEPSTPWPVAPRTASPGNNRRVPSRNQPCRSFAELRQRFTATNAEPPRLSQRSPLKPVVLSRGNSRNNSDLQAARELLDADPTVPSVQFTRFTRKLLTGPVHIPWEMTVPTLPASFSSTSDSTLQRKLKPSIRTNIGLLRDHLTHAQHLNWPRYANQRVFRKDDQLP